MIYIVVISSILLQLTATIIAVRLIKTTKRQFYWVVLALAMVLQLMRRTYSLLALFGGVRSSHGMLVSELIALIISILLVLGLIGIAKMFGKMKSDIKEQEEVISEKEKNSQLILDTVGVIVMILNQYGQVKMINRRGCQILGYNENEIIGKSWFEEFIPAEERDLAKNYLNRYINGGSYSPGLHESCVIRKDGTKRRILWENSLLKDEEGNITTMLATGKDITSRRQAEEEIELYFNTAVNLMGIAGMDGYLKRINPEWSKILGWSEEELLSYPFTSFVHPEDIEKMKWELMGFGSSFQVLGHVNRYMCKDGGYKWLEWNIKKLKERDAIIISAMDITPRIEMEKKNNELLKSKQMEIIKTEFFANMSHEFRTPLNMILSSLQMADMNAKKSEATSRSTELGKYSRIIRQNTFRLLKLVNNIVDLTKIDLGYFELERCNCNIVSIVEDITLSAVQYIEAQGISIEFDTNVEELIIACDPDKIERVLLNLLSNAVKFTEPGGNIWVNITNQSDKVIICVKDNGIGIEREKLDVIFDKFIQVDKSMTRRNEGSGIGLSIVKQLIELHGGTIEVNSELGGGSEFIIELPVISIQDNIKSEIESKTINSKIQMINIEFSDIYELKEQYIN